MLVGGFVSTVTVGDDGVQQILEDLIGLLITSNTADSHDEGVALGTKRKHDKVGHIASQRNIKILCMWFFSGILMCLASSCCLECKVKCNMEFLDITINLVEQKTCQTFCPDPKRLLTTPVYQKNHI